MYNIERTIANWKKDAMLTNPIAYSIDLNAGEITIYTTRPSWLIGKAGKLMENYETEMKKAWSSFTNFKLVEVWNVL